MYPIQQFLLLSFLPVVLFSSSAFASVEVAGTVVHEQCGTAQETSVKAGGYSINRVCSARITGIEGAQYFAVTESRSVRGKVRDRETLWKVAQITFPRGPRGPVVSRVYKVELAGNVVEGRLVSTSAKAKGFIRATSTLRVDALRSMRAELNGRAFTATDFKFIYRKKLTL